MTGTQFRSAALATLLVVSAVVTGCDEATPADNAAEFRERAARSGYEVAFAPVADGRPGLVSGVARSKDGVRSTFVFSFGPAPEELPGDFRFREEAAWFDAGDGVNYWVEGYPPGLSGAEQDRTLEMLFTLEDLACRTVANRPCDILPGR